MLCAGYGQDQLTHIAMIALVDFPASDAFGVGQSFSEFTIFSPRWKMHHFKELATIRYHLEMYTTLCR